MEETLLRDRVEIERRRDEARQLDRINAIERALAVLQTVFDAHREHAITAQDLEKLQKEVEAEMQKTIGHVCDHFDSRTDQQSKDLLSKVEGMFMAQQVRIAESQTAQHAAIREDQRRMRQQIFLMVMGSGLSVIGALVVFALTRG